MIKEVYEKFYNFYENIDLSSYFNNNYHENIDEETDEYNELELFLLILFIENS